MFDGYRERAEEVMMNEAQQAYSVPPLSTKDRGWLVHVLTSGV
jgi:hypothetical protein